MNDGEGFAFFRWQVLTLGELACGCAFCWAIWARMQYEFDFEFGPA